MPEGPTTLLTRQSDSPQGPSDPTDSQRDPLTHYRASNYSPKDTTRSPEGPSDPVEGTARQPVFRQNGARAILAKPRQSISREPVTFTRLTFGEQAKAKSRAKDFITTILFLDDEH